MNLLTVYEAYQYAELDKQVYRRMRRMDIQRGQMGIAVADDTYALEWQHRDRQSKKFDQWLRGWLKEIDDTFARGAFIGKRVNDGLT